MTAYLVSLLEIISPKVVLTKIDNSFKQLNWATETSNEIERRIRSLNPKHGAFTYLGDEKIKIFTIVWKMNTVYIILVINFMIYIIF